MSIREACGLSCDHDDGVAAALSREDAIDATRWRAATASRAVDATRKMKTTQNTDVVAIDKTFGGVALVRAARGVLVGLARRLGIPDLGPVVAQPEVALPLQNFRGDGTGRRLARENPQQRVRATFTPTDP